MFPCGQNCPLLRITEIDLRTLLRSSFMLKSEYGIEHSLLLLESVLSSVLYKNKALKHKFDKILSKLGNMLLLLTAFKFSANGDNT